MQIWSIQINLAMEKLIDGAWMHLAEIRRAAADAAQQEEAKSKEQMLQVLKSVEFELQKTQRENDCVIQDIIQRVESQAADQIECAKKEMNQKMSQLEDEIFQVAYSKMQEEWALREDNLKDEFHTIYSTELERQHTNLAAEFECIIREKDSEMKNRQEGMKSKLADIELSHRTQLDSMNEKMKQVAEEIWREANEAASEKVSKGLAMAEEQCQSKDGDIEMLLEDRAKLRELLQEKESCLQENIDNLNSVEKSFHKAAKEFNDRHQTEIAEFSEQAKFLMHENKNLQNAHNSLKSENDTLKGELVRFRSQHEALETAYCDQRDLLRSLDHDKKQSTSCISDALSCKQLLEHQLMDLKAENKELSATLQKQHRRIHELSLEHKKDALKASKLSTELESLQKKNKQLTNECSSIKKKYADDVENASALRREMDSRLKQKDILLAETISQHRHTLGDIKEEAKSRIDALKESHYRQSLSDADHSGFEKLTNECNNLRSRVLVLQRENFRLESDLVDAKELMRQSSLNRNHLHDVAKHRNKDSESEHTENEVQVQKINDENNALKEMINMMRREMETAVLNNADATDDDDVPMQKSALVLEKQLVQCRSYLNLLLKVGDNIGHVSLRNQWRTSRDEEVAFLRLNYQEQNQVLDEMRQEILR